MKLNDYYQNKEIIWKINIFIHPKSDYCVIDIHLLRLTNKVKTYPENFQKLKVKLSISPLGALSSGLLA